MIQNFFIAGHPEEVIEQLRTLEAQGLDAIVFNTPVDTMYQLIDDFSRLVISIM
jgi:alkanesulfonate monooxygenase SsuD/methylene tetrahydromethanopterin reductase-like flavin-dependent oxidoreductase (luciferase family)